MDRQLPAIVRMVLCGAGMMLLAGCGSDRLLSIWDSVTPTSSTPVETGSTRIPAPEAVAGRWILASTDAGACAMSFGAGTTEGTIAPDGNCPFTFFTSRKWTSEERGLVLRDHTDQVLVVLTPVGTSRYEGQTSSTQTVTLTR